MENNPTIGLEDLNNLLTIIDHCVKRGAFQPSEISAVGAVRDKLAAFIAHSVTELPATDEMPEGEVAE